MIEMPTTIYQSTDRAPFQNPTIIPITSQYLLSTIHYISTIPVSSQLYPSIIPVLNYPTKCFYSSIISVLYQYYPSIIQVISQYHPSMTLKLHSYGAIHKGGEKLPSS